MINHAMNADIHAVVAALADLGDDHLHALSETVNGVPQVAPGLLAWIEHVVDWQINRRNGVEFPLPMPGAAIPPEEGATSLDAALMLRARFAQEERGEAHGMSELLDGLVSLLSGAGAEALGERRRDQRCRWDWSGDRIGTPPTRCRRRRAQGG